MLSLSKSRKSTEISVAKPKGGKRPGAGRRKGSPNKVTYEVRMAAQKHGPAMLKELARLATQAESEAARVAAIKEMLDRAYGRSPQPLSSEDGGPPRIVIETHVVDHRAPAEVERRVLKIIDVVAEPSEGNSE